MLLNGYTAGLCQAKDIYRSRRKDVTVKGSIPFLLVCRAATPFSCSCNVSSHSLRMWETESIGYCSSRMMENKERMIWHREGGTLYTQPNKRKRRTTTFLAFLFGYDLSFSSSHNQRTPPTFFWWGL